MCASRANSHKHRVNTNQYTVKIALALTSHSSGRLPPPPPADHFPTLVWCVCVCVCARCTLWVRLFSVCFSIVCLGTLSLSRTRLFRRRAYTGSSHLVGSVPARILSRNPGESVQAFGATNCPPPAEKHRATQQLLRFGNKQIK